MKIDPKARTTLEENERPATSERHIETADFIERVALAAAHDLRSVMQGDVVLPSDEAYARTRQIWNGAVEYQPSLFALCETVKDIQAAVNIARKHDLPLSVRGGGHDLAGRALRHDGLVIDLTCMRNVEVDATARIATVQGGATAGDLINATSAHDLVAVTGTARCPSGGCA